MLEFDGQQFLDGRASDPRELGWMRGSPPPLDKRITFESDAFFEFPQIRWSLSHMRELWPTVNVRRGTRWLLDRDDRASDINAITFADMNGQTRNFEDALYDTYTDGIVVLHRGRIVYERYFGELSAELPHTCMSITKSYAATLVAAFVHEGVLDDRQVMVALRSRTMRDSLGRRDLASGYGYADWTIIRGVG
ncbi:CubicO group peptidase (beta-lactamase class C family) [Bradyrhizobium sp. GM24.11]